MKKYITLAALLAAGTACANAEDFAWDITWGADTSITFTPEADYELAVSGISSDVGYKSTTYQSGTYTPNVNVGNGGTWTLTFSVTNNSNEALVFDGLTLDVFTFNGDGISQGKDTDRSFTFTVTNGETDAVLQYGQLANNTISGSTSGSLTERDIVLSGLTIAAGETAKIALKAEKGSSNTLGSFVGLTGIKLSTIPEPSAFGMIAGLGALALVASRRRRK